MATLLVKKESADQEVFYGTVDECIAEYYQKHSGTLCYIKHEYYETDSGEDGCVSLPLDSEVWRSIAVEDKELDNRGLYKAYEIALDVLYDWRGKPPKDDSIIDDLGLDDVEPSHTEKIIIRATNKHKAFEIAKAMYPGSANGYNIIGTISNRVDCYNDFIHPLGLAWAEYLANLKDGSLWEVGNELGNYCRRNSK